MNWKILNQPLGMLSSTGYTPKKEIAWLPIALGVASLASSLWGAKKSSDAASEARAQQEAERARLEAERRRKQNQSWADTASGRNTIRVLNESARKFIKRAQGAAAVAGGTDAAVAIEKEQQNQKQADIIAQANAAFEDRKENIDASYRADLARVNQGIQQSKMAQADATAQAAEAASSAFMQGAMMTAEPTTRGVAPKTAPVKEPAGVSPGAGGGTVKPVKITPQSLFEHQGKAKTLDYKYNPNDILGINQNYNTLLGLKAGGNYNRFNMW